MYLATLVNKTDADGVNNGSCTAHWNAFSYTGAGRENIECLSEFSISDGKIKPFGSYLLNVCTQLSHYSTNRNQPKSKHRYL